MTNQCSQHLKCVCVQLDALKCLAEVYNVHRRIQQKVKLLSSSNLMKLPGWERYFNEIKKKKCNETKLTQIAHKTYSYNLLKKI